MNGAHPSFFHKLWRSLRPCTIPLAGLITFETRAKDYLKQEAAWLGVASDRMSEASANNQKTLDNLGKTLDDLCSLPIAHDQVQKRG